MKLTEGTELLGLIRSGGELDGRRKLLLTVKLSAPAIVAQLSSIVMQFIDASMVGHLGAEASASIGIVSTTTWLFWGMLTALATGFSVQVAHAIGAGELSRARSIFRQAITSTVVFSLLLAAVGCGISGGLPRWLGGADDICHDASLYFFVFALFLPALQLNFLGGAMLRCSGNMHVPSLLNMFMCVMDVVFNFFLIFPARDIDIFGVGMFMPGAGLGVLGAALGTVFAETVTAVLMMWYACACSKELAIAGEKGVFRPRRDCLRKAARISLPMGAEHAVLCGAQIFLTVIVAPLGTFAIAANAFAITAESLCYMPGYGIADAATTLVGQSLGAGRRELTRSFAWISVWLGIGVMTVMGIIMYVAAPLIMGIMTAVEPISELGAAALRIEAFAEPMFAASIVAYGVFVGAGDTLVPSVMNLGSMWVVRITLAALLAPVMGLQGVWLAMCIELCFRGAIFLVRLRYGNWMKRL